VRHKQAGLDPETRVSGGSDLASRKRYQKEDGTPAPYKIANDSTILNPHFPPFIQCSEELHHTRLFKQ
jgi:hypothetical protein